MKLNPECIRSVLLEIEKQHEIHITDENDVVFEPLWIENLYKTLPKYSKEDIFYTLFNLDQAGYISSNLLDGDDTVQMYAVNYITFEGHEFLEKIRTEDQWKTLKGILGAARNYSLDAINQAANGVASAAISKLVEKYVP